MKQITSDEALSNQLLRLYHKSSSGLRRVTATIKIIRKHSKKSIPEGCAFKKRKLCMEYSQHLTVKTDGIVSFAHSYFVVSNNFFLKRYLLAFQKEVLYNNTCR